MTFSSSAAVSRRAPRARDRRRRRPLFAAAICLIAAAAAGAAARIDHDALWKIVDGLCVFDQTTLKSPAPCAEVDLRDGVENGWAVLKDLVGRTQFLLIPTRRVTGMEDPLVGSAAIPNYWAPAWAARSYVETAAGTKLARETISLAINGAGARSQNQLHIHVDCARADVAQELRARAGEIGAAWSDFTMFGRSYRARRIEGEALAPDPFRLLAQDEASAPLKENSMAAFGAAFEGQPGFVLVAQKAPGGAAHLEDLQDHGCALAASAPATAQSHP